MKRAESTSVFTFILEYDGYTAISQFHGTNVQAALAAWGRRIATAK